MVTNQQELAEDLQSTPVRSSSLRVAGVVAEQLRSRILRGDLPDGSRLPKEDELRAAFGVGKPALREAMRILEEEGLVSIIRGNRGGAIVHAPTASAVAYSLGLSLTARAVTTADVGAALREIEPICASLCARRPDRRREVIPQLRSLVAESESAVLDSNEISILSRRFHERMVASCGNETLIVLVGALEVLWSSHVRGASVDTYHRLGSPLDATRLRRSVSEHRRIVELIASGDADGVRVAVTQHLDRVQKQATAANEVRPVNSSILKGVLHPEAAT